MRNTPCRLYGLLATRADIGVILRRGPTKRTRIILWNTLTDEFEVGPWLEGRVDERHCDLSPSGRLLVYFAANFSTRAPDAEHRSCTWTAVCRPPSPEPLALWPLGDCWWGGGAFESDRRLVLYHPDDRAERDPRLPEMDLEVRLARDRGEYPITMALARRGWIHVGTRGESFPRETWSRAQPGGEARLEMSIRGFASHWPGGVVLVFRVRLGSDEAILEGPVTWADWDQRGRLVFTRDGKLHAYVVPGDRSTRKELADFNGELAGRFPGG